MTESASGTARPKPGRRPPAAVPSRIVAGGAALGLGLALVGGMAAGAESAAAPAPAEHIVRVVVDRAVVDRAVVDRAVVDRAVVDRASPTSRPPGPAGSTVAVPDLPRTEPGPAAGQANAEPVEAPVTESGGS